MSSLFARALFYCPVNCKKKWKVVMPSKFFPEARMMLIGSQPLEDHGEASDLVFEYAGEIPNWAQLPVYPQELMVPQFAGGLPGLVDAGEKLYADTGAQDFEAELLTFFEEYLAAVESSCPDDDSRFALTPRLAKGFFTFLDGLIREGSGLSAVKGQVTGPITFCTTLKDQEGRAIFYHDGLRDAAVKLLALKAVWQVEKLSAFKVPVILFIDEPALAGYGSSELISISREQIAGPLEEVIAAIHEHGGLAGVHVCANTDWSILLSSSVQIINFDAYGYFDKFILYGDQIKVFLENGGCLAWGLVPTLMAEEVEKADLETIWQLWKDQSARIQSLGGDAQTLKRQSLITPSCGTGSLPRYLSLKVLKLTRELSRRIRETI